MKKKKEETNDNQMFGKLLINCCLSLKKLKRKFFFYQQLTHNYACFTVLLYCVAIYIPIYEFVLYVHTQHLNIHTITYDVWLWPISLSIHGYISIMGGEHVEYCMVNSILWIFVYEHTTNENHKKKIHSQKWI